MTAVETPETAAETRRCPRCGSTLTARQEWCLQCGADVSSTIAAPPSWRGPVALVGGLLAIGALAIAGPLDPPAGPITPSFKTLTEVEPRIAVQSLPASDEAVHAITAPGTYYLTGDIVVPENKAGIHVASDRVTLDLNGFSDIINGLSGAGTVDNVAGGGASTLTVGANNTTSSFGGAIQNTTGTTALVKIGSGTLTLSGANSHAGSTNVNAGTLVAANASALGTTATGTAVASGATTASRRFTTRSCRRSCCRWLCSRRPMPPSGRWERRATGCAGPSSFRTGCRRCGLTTCSARRR